MCSSLQYRTQCRVSAQTHLCLPHGIGKDGKEEEKGRGEGREEASEPQTKKTPTTLTVVQSGRHATESAGVPMGQPPLKNGSLTLSWPQSHWSGSGPWGHPKGLDEGQSWAL